MSDLPRIPLERWRVRYAGDESSREISVPHAWRQDLPVSDEGPVDYETQIEVPKGGGFLHFHGVSYQAEIFANEALLTTHKGIWDAFSVPLHAFQGKTVQIRVRVTKNGGPTFPVQQVVSGFLPFVFHTFGGIYAEVEFVPGSHDPVAERESQPQPASRVQVEGSRVLVDGQPFYPRGLLSWGWYPEFGHPNPPLGAVRSELRAAKALGFNLVKFCLWIPRPRFLKVLEEEGMFAWIELPLWDPSRDPQTQQNMAEEIERIVRQYRAEPSVIAWTVGCELGAAVPAALRARLTAMVHNLTGCPLVKDDSGGAEMYGGDLREFGEFYDFHPYCDTPFYPAVLDSLLPTGRKQQPIFLGEFNDLDVHRDLARTHDEVPFWASTLDELNAQGVRWSHDLPKAVHTSRFSLEHGASRHTGLMESSRQKALFVRKTVQEAVRARQAISGYVITGWRDTPISSSGFFDDWGASRFSPEETKPWNGPATIYLLPNRRPPWHKGGNRPGLEDPLNRFPGQAFWRIGVHSDSGLTGRLTWAVRDPSGKPVAEGFGDSQSAPALASTEIGQIDWEALPGEYSLEVSFARAENVWPIWIVQEPSWKPFSDWGKFDPAGLLADVPLKGERNLLATRIPPDLEKRLKQGQNVLLFLLDEGTQPCPFWREAAIEFRDDGFWGAVPFKENWPRLLPVSPDCAIDPAWLKSLDLSEEILLNRIDVRTYAEAPVLVRAKSKGKLIATTLRPFGGLGSQPAGITRNPAGSALLTALLADF